MLTTRNILKLNHWQVVVFLLLFPGEFSRCPNIITLQPDNNHHHNKQHSLHKLCVLNFHKSNLKKK